jgi:hypothetical protein
MINKNNSNLFLYRYNNNNNFMLNIKKSYIDLSSHDIVFGDIRQNNQNRYLNFIKGFSFFNYDNLKINNDYIYYKIINFDILFFIKFLNPIFFFKIFKIFKLIIFIYISFITYEIFHKYISLIKSLRKIN